MFTPLCALPLPAELFALAVHPASPLVALGFATGHVLLDRLPSSSLYENDQGLIQTLWKTRRHKGSCRCLTFTSNGQYIISAGTDRLVKCADSETGRVMSKIAIPLHEYERFYLSPKETHTHKLTSWMTRSGEPDPPTLLSSPTPQHLLLATDSSDLHIYDLRVNTVSHKPQQTHNPHVDYVSSLTPLPASGSSTSGLPRQTLTTGDTTIAITDLRKGIVKQSEDIGEELLSSALVGNKIVVGSEKGVLRVWEVGEWDNEPERIHTGGIHGEGADILASIPEKLEKQLGCSDGGVIAGMGDGGIKIVRLGKGKGKAMGEIRHDEIEPVGGLGFEVGGRMISGGGDIVKVWEQATIDGAQDQDLESAANGGDGVDSDDQDDEGDNESSDEEEKQRKRKKRKKKGKGSAKSVGNGILGFRGMD